MKNIIKSQLYQLKKNKLAFGIFFIVLFLQTFQVFAAVINQIDGKGITGSSFVADAGSYLFLIPLFYISMITGMITGTDFMDKTTNYEIMTGHSRGEVYFGRAIPSVIISVVVGTFLAVVPAIVASIVFGWGTKVKLSGIVVRYILVMFPYFRIVCELIFLTFIVRNSYVIMAVGYVYFILGMTLSEASGTVSSVLLGLTNLNLLGRFESFSTYNVLNGADTITVYDSSIHAVTVISTIVASLFIGGFFLMLGYVFFKKDDLS